MDGANFAAELPRQNIGQRRGKVAAAARAKLGSFVGMPHSRQAGWFLDDNDMSVAKADDWLVRWTLGHGLRF
jgi:hypothetical protein